MLNILRERMAVSPHAVAAMSGDAAVLMAVTDEALPQLILTLRAQHLNAHAGEVAFPGGKRDATDASLAATALRESQEEIGLDPALVQLLGPSRLRRSRWGLQVRPFVGIVPADVRLAPSADELERIFRVPLAHFVERANLQIQTIERDGRPWQAPCYDWQGTQIWGLTAIMIVDLLNDVYDFGVEIWR